MRIARFQRDDQIAYGVVEGDEIAQIEGDIFSHFTVTGRRHPLSDVKLLAPTIPTTCMAIGRNYADHLAFAAKMLGREVEVPPLPHPWRKGENSIIGPGEPIVIPNDSSGDVHYEGELVVVIGKPCRRATLENALDYVLGYTCGNDVSERQWQKSDFSFWRAKGCDTFGPVGPWMVTDIDPTTLDLEVRLNGKVVQKSHTSQFIHSIPLIIATVSQGVTLWPGDLIFTGTPGETSSMKPGDVVEVEFSGIGVLRNPVVAEDEA